VSQNRKIRHGMPTHPNFLGLACLIQGHGNRIRASNASIHTSVLDRGNVQLLHFKALTEQDGACAARKI
jgi:hypothetical protein